MSPIGAGQPKITEQVGARRYRPRTSTDAAIWATGARQQFREVEPECNGVVRIHLDALKVRGPIPEPWDVLDHGLNLTAAKARQLGSSVPAIKSAAP